MSFNLVKLIDPIQLINIPGGLVPRGAYSAGTNYAVGDSVDYQGSSYVMFNDAGAGTVPTNTTYWQVLANKGDTGATGATGPAGADGGTYTTAVQTSSTRNETTTTGTIIVLCDCTSNSITVNLPTAVGNTATIVIKKTDSSSNSVTIDGATTQTIDGGLTATLQVQEESITIISDNTNWRII